MINKNDINFRVIRTNALKNDEREMVHNLFDLSYRQANHSYLEKSFSKLRYISLATFENALVGFAVADTIKTYLPRLADPQFVMLAGLCCVHSNYRRLGLFRQLESMAASAGNFVSPIGRFLACGRMAHPAAFRTMKINPSVIPKYGVPLSDWHKEVGLKVASLYGVNIDPETLVVIGGGSPIGYPNIDCDVAEEEWLPFKGVNRDRGDNLLGICWLPDAPEGW